MLLNIWAAFATNFFPTNFKNPQSGHIGPLTLSVIIIFHSSLSLLSLSLSLSLCGSLSSPKVRCHSSSLREILKNFLNKSRGRTLKVYKRRLSTEEQLKRRPQADQPTTSRSCNIASTNVNDNVVIVIIIIIICLRTARHWKFENDFWREKMLSKEQPSLDPRHLFQ